MIKNQFNWFGIIVAFSALVIAGTAAYFSIFGLSKLFGGAMMSVAIMASVLEFGKLVAVSFIYRERTKISNFLTVYLGIGVIILMIITSLGIYGFLSNAYQQTASGLNISNQKIEVLEIKKQMFITELENIQKQINFRNTRVIQLANLRSQQEVRLDTLYQGGNFRSAYRTESNIDEANLNIDKLNNEITKLGMTKVALVDSAGVYSIKIAEYSVNEYVADLGPLLYLSNLSGWSMDRVVNILILMLIFVFDPMAIALTMAFNHMFMGTTEIKISNLKPKKKWKFPWALSNKFVTKEDPKKTIKKIPSGYVDNILEDLNIPDPIQSKFIMNEEVDSKEENVSPLEKLEIWSEDQSKKKIKRKLVNNPSSKFKGSPLTLKDGGVRTN